MNLLCVILFAVVLMLVGVCLWQRRVIHNKNRAIVKSIDVVMGTGTWVWVPVFMAIFLLSGSRDSDPLFR